MRQQNVEQLFKDTFSNYEADVNPSAWANIEQGLPSAPQNIPGSSPVARPSGFFGKISLNTILLVTAISATLIGTTIYLSSQESGSADALVPSVQAQPQIAQNNVVMPSQTEVAVSDATPVEALNTGNESKNTTQPSGGLQEKVNVIAPAQQASTPVETKTQNAPNLNEIVLEPNTPEPANTAVGKGQESGNPAVVPTHAVTENNQDGGNKMSSTNPIHFEPLNGPEDILAEAGPAMEIENEEQFRFYIPNVFTPNSDMMNDFYKPVVNTNLKDYEMTIYDRYGFEIFKSRDVNYGWDGKLKDGNLAATAVYVCIIKLVDFKNEEHSYIKGFLLFK